MQEKAERWLTYQYFVDYTPKMKLLGYREMNELMNQRWLDIVPAENE